MTSYRQGAEQERARSFALSALSPETQGRLRQALLDRGEILLADWQSLHGSPWHWGALGALGLALAGYALSHRFGDLAASPRPPMLQQAWAAVGLSVAAAGAALAARQRSSPSVPRGVFVLPLDLVDTRGDLLKIIPLSSLLSATDQGSSLLLAFDGGLLYRFANVQAASFREATQAVEQRLSQAAARRDDEVLRKADPFFEQRKAWPSDGARGAPEPSPWRLLVPLIVAAAVAGFASASAVQRASDRSAIARAEREADSDALLDYAARGGMFSDEADRVALAMAARDAGHAALFRYMSRGLRRVEAERLLIERVLTTHDEALLLRCFAHGGKIREVADQTFFSLATSQRSEPLMRSYIRNGGARAQQVEAEILPEFVLHQALSHNDVQLLKLLARKPEELPEGAPVQSSEALRAAASERLDLLHKKELAALEPSFRATPLARAIFGLISRSSSPFHRARVRVTAEQINLITNHFYSNFIAEVAPFFSSALARSSGNLLDLESADNTVLGGLPPGFDGQIHIEFDFFRDLYNQSTLPKNHRGKRILFGSISVISRGARLSWPFQLSCLKNSSRRQPAAELSDSFHDLLFKQQECSVLSEFKPRVPSRGL